MSELTTAAEQQLAYNIEVLGMPIGRAGALAGIADALTTAKRPGVLKLRRAYKREMLQRADITKNDVIGGLRDAIDDARLLGDPQAQVRGWVEVAKLKGYYEPQVIRHIIEDGNINEAVRHMTTDELLKLTNDADIIDVDFIEIENG